LPEQRLPDCFCAATLVKELPDYTLFCDAGARG
jgi:hypothetical protein